MSLSVARPPARSLAPSPFLPLIGTGPEGTNNESEREREKKIAGERVSERE